jgi:hypothetical protein
MVFSKLTQKPVTDLHQFNTLPRRSRNCSTLVCPSVDLQCLWVLRFLSQLWKGNLFPKTWYDCLVIFNFLFLFEHRHFWCCESLQIPSFSITILSGCLVPSLTKRPCKLSRNSMHLSHSVNRVDSQLQPELGYMHPPFSEICHQSQTVNGCRPFSFSKGWYQVPYII